MRGKSDTSMPASKLKTGRCTVQLSSPDFPRSFEKVRIEKQANGDGLTRVLQIVENLDNRAVESWLVRVFSQAVVQQPELEWTFFCVLPKSGEFDDQVSAAGGYVIHSQHELHNKIPFMAALRRVMRLGRYDILHCHQDIMSAAYLLASSGLPFKKRIVHLHNTALSLPTPNRLKAQLVRGPMRQVCLHMADQIVGISREALESLVGATEHDPARHQVVHYAVDTSRFRNPSVDRVAFRRELGFSPGAKVILFVGRMVDYKNPCFVVDVLEHVARFDSDTVAVFVGAGDQQCAVKAAAERKHLPDRVKLLGFRDDVPEVMLACDLLIWPSQETPKEGLGLGVVEAQAAGLRILMSQSVPLEAVVVSELVEVLPLAAGPALWAESVVKLLDRPIPGQEQCLMQVESSSFAMQAGLDGLLALYNS
jgi:glycosyltransferase involved in cell wall biosynthesis